MEKTLVKFEAVEQALAEAQTIIEVKNIRDQAEALRQCAKLAGFGLDYQNRVAEIKIRAERRAGEMLEELVPSSGGRPRKNLATMNRFSTAPTLGELGITHYQSRRWRLQASVPEDIFGLYVTAVKLAGDELTSAGVLRLAKELQQKAEESRSDPEATPKPRSGTSCPRSALLYRDQWLTVWDGEVDESYVRAGNSVALVVTNGKSARHYLLEAMQGFIVTPVRK